MSKLGRRTRRAAMALGVSWMLVFGLAEGAHARYSAPTDTKVGTACKVTSGANAGKSGTYTRDDEGNLWCEGDWGGTQCGTGKCSDAGRHPNRPSGPRGSTSGTMAR